MTRGWAPALFGRPVSCARITAMQSRLGIPLFKFLHKMKRINNRTAYVSLNAFLLVKFLITCYSNTSDYHWCLFPTIIQYYVLFQARLGIVNQQLEPVKEVATG